MGVLSSLVAWARGEKSDGSCCHSWLTKKWNGFCYDDLANPVCRRCYKTKRQIRLETGTASKEDEFQEWMDSVPSREVVRAMRLLQKSDQDTLVLEVSNGRETRKVRLSKDTPREAMARRNKQLVQEEEALRRHRWG